MNDNNPEIQPTTDKPTGPVTFNAQQQAKIDEIVKDSMRRASKEIRQQLEQEKQERARLQTDLESAQSALASALSSDERDRLAAEVQQLSSDLANEKAGERYL